MRHFHDGDHRRPRGALHARGGGRSSVVNRRPAAQVGRRGRRWLIFALPPAELAVHPASSDGGEVALYLMCDDIESTMRELRDKGAAFDGSVANQPWGRVTKIVLPSGGRLGLYEPSQATPLYS